MPSPQPSPQTTTLLNGCDLPGKSSRGSLCMEPISHTPTPRMHVTAESSARCRWCFSHRAASHQQRADAHRVGIHARARTTGLVPQRTANTATFREPQRVCLCTVPSVLPTDCAEKQIGSWAGCGGRGRGTPTSVHHVDDVHVVCVCVCVIGRVVVYCSCGVAQSCQRHTVLRSGLSHTVL